MLKESHINIAELAASFSSPPAKYSPAPIWWWSGERLERERLRWQLEHLSSQGVFNVVIINMAPSSPLFGGDADDPIFFSEEWWEIFLGVCEDARELGMHILFYDQIGFSGANLQGILVSQNPAFAGQWLSTLTVEGDGPLELTTPGKCVALGASITNLTTGESQAVPHTGAGVIHSGSGLRRLRLNYVVQHGFDYLNPAACQTVINQVHGEFERRAGRYLGNVIVGSFQDELPMMPTWGPNFAQAFEERCGYALQPDLTALWEGEDDHSRRVRADFQATRAALAEQAFFKPLFDWHARYDLLCGMDQTEPSRSGDPKGGVRLYANYMKTQRWYTAPGSDHHGEGKIHSSLSHLYDRPRTWIESFHSSGWGGTLEETFDWLLPWLRSGANLYNPHAVYYSTRGGWWEWAPPSTCWRQPYWQDYRQFAEAVTRLCFMLTRGKHICDIGLLYPTTTIQAAFTPEGPLPAANLTHETYKALVGSMRWYNTIPGVFDRACRDYDILDDDSLQRAEISGGALTIGGESYKMLVLPNCTVLEPDTAQVLVRFVKNGGRLVAVGGLAELVTGSDQQVIEELKGLFANGQAAFIAAPEDLPAVMAGLPRSVEAPVPTLYRHFEGGRLLFVPAISPRATQEPANAGWRDFQYNFDPQRYHKTMQVKIKGERRAPQLWEPSTGRRRRLAARPLEDGIEVEIPFEDGPAVLLVWPDEDQAAEEALPVATPSNADVEKTVLTLNRWESELAPTIDNRYGDLALPAHPGAPPVQTWRFRHRAEKPGEDGLAENWPVNLLKEEGPEVEATFGTFGWWTGPAGPADWTGPLSALAQENDPLATAGWKPATYSLSRGIARDPIHADVLGPKGHVPEEFLLFGPVAPGEGVRFRTSLWSEKQQNTFLALGAPAAKRAWFNGKECSSAPQGYLWLTPVTLQKGRNLLEWELVAEQKIDLRASWALVRDPQRYFRPEWLAARDVPVRNSRLRFYLTFDIPFAPREGTLQVGCGDYCSVIVNGSEIGRQGGFDPYLEGRVQPYTTTAWRQGENKIVLETLDSGRGVTVVADGLVYGKNGETAGIRTGVNWQVQRNDGPLEPVVLRRRQWIDQAWFDRADSFREMDPAFTHLWRRPHPLPETGWLEGTSDDSAMLRLVPEAFQGQNVEWFGWKIPPGATSIFLPVHGEIRLWVDGKEIAVSGNLNEVREAKLTGKLTASRSAALRVEPRRSYNGGAVFTGPVYYQTGRGSIEPGPWADQGLEAYSGGLRYLSEFELLDRRPGARLVVDLGRVRGTARVTLNGQPAGLRVWSPYRYDITNLVKAGVNSLEILVNNTLAPYLRATSPTNYVLPGQEVSGLFGPVTIRTVQEAG